MSFTLGKSFVQYVVQLFHPFCNHIGIFYYTLGNISPQFRSQLKAIQFLCVAKSSVINKYGANNILQTMMNDVILLEEVHTYIIIHKLF